MHIYGRRVSKETKDTSIRRTERQNHNTDWIRKNGVDVKFKIIGFLEGNSEILDWIQQRYHMVGMEMLYLSSDSISALNALFTRITNFDMPKTAAIDTLITYYRSSLDFWIEFGRGEPVRQVKLVLCTLRW